MTQLKIAPSILASDFANLADECRAVLSAGADWLHVDVMDGHYVPNLTIGLPVVESLRAACPDAFLDVHLMISNPDEMAPEFADAGADLVSFHPEPSDHPHRTVQKLHDAGVRAGVALNPGTPVDWIDYLAEDLDLVLAMSVNPGFGGQTFIDTTLRKLREINQRLEQLGTSCAVEVDGGVKPHNAADIHRAGADVLVAGSAIFGADDYREAIDEIRTRATTVQV